MTPCAVSDRYLNWKPALIGWTPALIMSITAVIISTVFPKLADAQRVAQSTAHKSASPVPGGGASVDERRLELDRDRLEFEKQKFVVETKRENDELENEKTKQIWSAASAIAPIIAALFTLGYSVWSFRKQSVAAATLQNDTAKLQFDMKAAEIAFAGKTPEAVENRAKLLKKIFGKRLPDNFPPHFEPEEHGGGKEAPEGKLAFVEMLLKYPGQDQKIFRLWSELFGDAWLKKVEPVLTGGSGQECNHSAPKEPDVGKT